MYYLGVTSFFNHGLLNIKNSTFKNTLAIADKMYAIEKGKPSERMGRKTAGLIHEVGMVAGLPIGDSGGL